MSPNSQILYTKYFCVHAKKRTLSKIGGKEQKLSVKLFNLVSYFAAHPNRVVTRSELRKYIYTSRTSDAQVNGDVMKLRRLICTEAFVTMSGGYMVETADHNSQEDAIRTEYLYSNIHGFFHVLAHRLRESPKKLLISIIVSILNAFLSLRNIKISFFTVLALLIIIGVFGFTIGLYDFIIIDDPSSLNLAAH